jgi:RNA recognition motif-containing protein
MNKLYVGNLSWHTTDQQLREFFEQAGKVASAVVILDRNTGRSRGFGFVEMSDAEGIKKAIKMLDGIAFNKRNIVVNEARTEGENGDQDFIRKIKEFVLVDSKIGDKFGFSSGEKHFIVTRDA